MQKQGPGAEEKLLGVDHHYVLSTPPVSIGLEDPLPLILTDKAGHFTRDGKKAGFYSSSERGESLRHHRAFAKNKDALIDIDGVAYGFPGSTPREGVKVLTVNADDILLLANHSVTRYVDKLGWGEESLMFALSNLSAASKKIDEGLHAVFNAESKEDLATAESITRISLKKEIDEFSQKAWMHFTGKTVPEVVKWIKDGRIDLLKELSSIYSADDEH